MAIDDSLGRMLSLPPPRALRHHLVSHAGGAPHPAQRNRTNQPNEMNTQDIRDALRRRYGQGANGTAGEAWICIEEARSGAAAEALTALNDNRSKQP